MFPAGSAVQLVGSGQPAAHPVRQPALLGDMVLEIRWGLHSVLSDNRKHMSLHVKLLFNVFYLTTRGKKSTMSEETKACQSKSRVPGPQFIMSLITFKIRPPSFFFFHVGLFVHGHVGLSSFSRCFHGPSGMTFPSDRLFLPPMIFHPFLTSFFLLSALLHPHMF